MCECSVEPENIIQQGKTFPSKGNILQQGIRIEFLELDSNYLSTESATVLFCHSVTVTAALKMLCSHCASEKFLSSTTALGGGERFGWWPIALGGRERFDVSCSTLGDCDLALS